MQLYAGVPGRIAPTEYTAVDASTPQLCKARQVLAVQQLKALQQRHPAFVQLEFCIRAHLHGRADEPLQQAPPHVPYNWGVSHTCIAL